MTTYKPSKKHIRKQSKSLSSKAKFLRVVLLILFGLSIFGYTWLTNDLSVKGYALESLKEEKTGLEKETGRLQLLIANKKSPQKLREQVKELGLVKVEEAEFITETSGSVVLSDKK